MLKHKYAVTAQLHLNNNQALIEYFEMARHTYAKALRETFQVIKHAKKFNKSQFNTYLQVRYGIMKRTANSIISDAQGRLNALKELKNYEQKQLTYKINSLAKYVEHLVELRNDNCAMLRAGLAINLVKHRNLRRKIVAKQRRLNHLKQQLNNLCYQIQTNNYKLCFGTKRLLQTDYQKFVELRDSQMTFVGSKDETTSNQMLQLKFNARNNQFQIRLRKDAGGFKNGNDKYVNGQCYFNHYQSSIKTILRDGNSPLTYKVIKRNDRYYLICVFEIQQVESSFTDSDHGTIGIDFNKGFVTVSETNCYGHMLNTQRLNYRFKAGNKTTTDLEKTVNTIVKQAENTCKAICVEKLNFQVTKGKTQSKRGKKYNEMIHSFAYRKFLDLVERITYRHNISVNYVNPAWTSWLAKQLYCDAMKLNIHNGASYVIARRGQGFYDSVNN